MAPERLPAPERASSEIAEMIDCELAPHAACDHLCEVIVPDRRYADVAGHGKVPNADLTVSDFGPPPYLRRETSRATFAAAATASAAKPRATYV